MGTSSPVSELSSGAGASTYALSRENSAGLSSTSGMGVGVEIEEEEEDEGEGLFVIGDDGSEASEVGARVCGMVDVSDAETDGQTGAFVK